MRPSRSCFALLVVLFSAVVPGYSQSPAPVTPLKVLPGTLHPWAQPKYDRGAVDDSFPMRRLLLTMARSPEREAALRQFLHDAHTPASPQYHQWLTPQEYGARFGATEDDLQVVSAWLQAHGFSLNRVTSSRSLIEFSGTAATVRDAFHTEVHKYQAAGKTFYANSSEIAVPEAIASRVRSFAPLNNLPLNSYAEPIGEATFSRATHRALPKDTTTEGGSPFYALAPEDYATQYDIAPLYKAGVDGTGVTIAILGTANINLALVDAYRKLFALPTSHTQVIVDGNDPGDPFSPNVEAFLDVEASGAVAPGATIDYYVAAGQPFQDVLALAALRAVEDNQAAVISASYGQCEQLLGEAGNQLWASLWEQAAAQGQTVMVASGDSGPTSCPNLDTLASPSTLGVNGLSSTPWNVSVGGTDFYYSDYPSGAPSAATLWNQTNDPSLGSLKASLLEQPWSDALGLNAIPYNFNGAITIPSAAGGGGVSTCSQETTPAPDITPSCIAGYPKPDWQNAPGVPNDGARDLPDVSLFAAVGRNLSAWAICVTPWECNATSGTLTQVDLVGGTSAASPAMAGIMALVNQKYGRQGQANYILYPLARQIPSVFHDLTLGTNDVLCSDFVVNPTAASVCNTPIPGASPFFVESYGIYSAAAGYDLASGLGSLDVNQLIQNWNKATFTASATTLQLSPASVVHGAAVAATISVNAASGAGVPTGNVVLSSTSPTPIPQNIPLALANGSASANLTTLPGGAYTVTAQYGGDAKFAASTSAPVSLTVAPEPSTTTLNPVYTYTDSSSPVVQKGVIASGASVPFGSAWFFEATPSGQNSTATGLATGTATFTDGATTATVPLNANGVATWSPQSLALGSHSVAVKYSGDASYNASSAGPLAFTVVKGTPALTAVPEGLEQAVFGNSPGFAFAAGSTLVVHVTLRNQGSFIPPTGNVTVNLGSMSQTYPVTANSYLNEGLSTVFATFNNVPAGTYSLSASYTGDTYWNPSTYTATEPLTFAAFPLSATTTALTLTPSSVDSAGSVTFHVTVQASEPLNGDIITSSYGVADLYANGTEFAGIVLSQPAVAGATTFTGSLQIPAAELPLGTLQVTAAYQGFFSLAPSVSAAVPLTVTASDFQLAAAGANLVVKSGQSLTVPVNLGGSYGNTIAVSLTCAGSSNSIGCAITPGTVSVSGSGTATLTVNAYIPGTSSASAPNRWLPVGGTLALSLLCGVLLPTRRRRMVLSLWLCAALGAAFFVGCGGSPGHTTSPTPPQPANVNAPPGNYSVVVTGVSGGITHNTKVNFVVQ